MLRNDAKKKKEEGEIKKPILVALYKRLNPLGMGSFLDQVVLSMTGSCLFVCLFVVLVCVLCVCGAIWPCCILNVVNTSTSGGGIVGARTLIVAFSLHDPVHPLKPAGGSRL